MKNTHNREETLIKTLSSAEDGTRKAPDSAQCTETPSPSAASLQMRFSGLRNRYSKTWSFTDINYAIAGKEDKTCNFSTIRNC